jgi:GTPase SAR1 family protein
MKVLDFWVELSEARLNWAYEAQRRFVASFQDERIKELYATNRQKDIFVAVFGPSQVGKTSLILRLIGVDPEYMATVIQALRGGREEGRSSTVTSMMYAASPDQNYYVKGTQGHDWVTCCNEKEVSEWLRLLREEVEVSFAYSVQPVEIRIPQRYFTPNQRSDIHVRMMDLPGIYSSTPEEQDHVLRVIHHYLPQANLILLVNQAKQLASFQHFGIESIDEWRFVPDKFRIVLTHSVSANSIREMIQEVPPEAFHKHFYEEFARTVVRFPNEIMVYPLEYGNSWDQMRLKKFPWFEQYDRHMENLFDQLRNDINESANEYSQVRMNYRLYRSVEEKLREKEEWFEQGRIELEHRMREMKEHLKELNGYLRKIDAQSTDLEQLIGALKDLELKPAIPILPACKDGEKSVKRLRRSIHDRVDQMMVYADQILERYECRVEGLLSMHPGCPIPARSTLKRLKAGDLENTINSFLVHLNSYTFDFYVTWFSSNWSRDLNKLNELISEVHTVGVRIVHSSIRKDWQNLHHTLLGEKRKLLLKRKVTLGRQVDQQAELAVVKAQLESHEAKFEAFWKQAERDRETALSFQRYVDQCFDEAYASAVKRINSNETNSTHKWLYLMNLKNLQNQYLKLTEEA